MSRSSSKAKDPITVGFRTDVGCVRPQNEDSIYVKLPLLVVADGIGGQEAGEVASQIAVETMAEDAPEYVNAKLLGQAVIAANHEVMRGVETGRGKPGMGTTMTAALVEGNQMAVAQVGDSRAYRLRDGHLEQLTHDHSLIAAMIESGQITAEEARNHPSRSIITKALGSDPDMVPDLFEFELKKGDKILLCSDGLSSMIYDSDIEQILKETPDPQDAAEKLVDAAKEAGGMDNVSVIVANISNDKPAEEQKRARKLRTSAIVFSIIGVLLIASACGGFYYYVHNSAYLVNQDGYVAVYGGRMDEFFGNKVSWYVRTTDVQTANLPALTSERLATGIQFDSMDAAENAVSDYETQQAQTLAQEALRATAQGQDGQADQNAAANGTATTTDAASGATSTNSSTQGQ